MLNELLITEGNLTVSVTFSPNFGGKKKKPYGVEKEGLNSRKRCPFGINVLKSQMWLLPVIV